MEQNINLPTIVPQVEKPKSPASPAKPWRSGVLFVTLVLLLASTIFFAYQNMQLKKELATKQTSTKPANYEECTKINGAVIQESYPAVCVTPQGDRFTQSVNLPDDSTNSSPASVDMANWKTYTNTEVGFSFKYPSEWKVQTGIPNSGLISLETSNDNRFFVWFSPSVTISEWLEETQSGKIIGKKTIGGYTFTVIQGGSNLESLEYALDVKGNGIVRFVIEPNSNNSDSEKLFDQILFTFKFLK